MPFELDATASPEPSSKSPKSTPSPSPDPSPAPSSAAAAGAAPAREAYASAPTPRLVSRAASPLAFTETQAGPPRGQAPRLPGESLAPGRQLAHFRIERLLGAGGMGEVYLATDLALDRPVALKVLAHGTSTPQRRDRLIREARAQARIQHANVCHIYYIGESEGLLFFAMELVTGATFAERIAQGAVAPELALELVRKAALGLREANRCGFTHRDVKPSNLMIDQHGEVKVMDFGLVAGSPEHGEDGAGSIEQTSLAGTPLYMAPEQARGEPIDLRADIYALGATLFHLVAGKPPFAGDNAAELLHQHSSAARPALVRHDLSARDLASVQGLCERMMAKHPADRHASYDELIRDLELLSSLHSPPAGATVRITAAVVDLLVCVPALIAVSWISSDLDGVVSFTLIFGLVRVLLLSWLGRSLGHAVFELEVVNMKDGQRPALRQAAVRGLWQLGLPLVAIALWGLSMLGVPRMSTISNVGAIAAYGFLCAHLYFASIRRAKRRTFWDRRSHTMVRYRRR